MPVLTPSPTVLGYGSLILSDGDREIDLVGDPFDPDGLYLVEFNPPVPVTEDIYATSPDMDGSSRTRTKPQNPEGAGKLRATGTSANAFWDVVDDIEELVASAHAGKGTLRYTPPGGTQITLDLEAFRFTEMPHDTSLQHKRLEIGFAFTCRPYGCRARITLLTAHALTGPIDSVEIADVKGHVDGLAYATFTDADGQPRDDVEWGIADVFDPGDPVRLAYTDLLVSGFSGTVGTGQVEGVTQDDWLALCGLDEQPHVGSYRVKAWIVAATTDCQVRLSHRNGYEPLGTNPDNLAVPHLAGPRIEVDLGIVTSTEGWSGQIEIRGDTVGDFAVRAVQILPAGRSGRIRAPSPPLVVAPATYDADDDFTQTVSGGSDPLDGITSRSGDVWDSFGGVDFAVSDTLVACVRSEDSEVYPGGRYALLGPSASAQGARVSVNWSKIVDGGATDLEGIFSLVLRCDGTDQNWLQLGLAVGKTNGAIFVAKRVAGFTEVIVPIEYSPWYAIANSSYLLSGTVDINGTFALYVDGQKKLNGYDDDLVIGGALGTGKPGIFDGYAGASTVVRAYHNYATWTPPIDHAVWPDRAAYIETDDRGRRKVERDNEDGTGRGKVPHYEGKRMLLPPATRSNRSSRLVVKQDPNDLVTAPVADAGYGLTLDLDYVPRVLLTTRNT